MPEFKINYSWKLVDEFSRAPRAKIIFRRIPFVSRPLLWKKNIHSFNFERVFESHWERKEKKKKRKGKKEKKIVYIFLFTVSKIVFPSIGETIEVTLFVIRLTDFFPPPLVVADTLSLGDRQTMDNMDRHGGQGRPRNQMLDPPNMKLKVEPTFDYSQNTNVTALIGKTAYLTCRVRNLGDKSVRSFISFNVRRPTSRAIFPWTQRANQPHYFLEHLFLFETCFRVGIRILLAENCSRQVNVPEKWLPTSIYIYIYTIRLLSIQLLHGVSTNLWQEGNHDKGLVHRWLNKRARSSQRR